jgi:phospholipid-binding lipoprotein MlaA
MTSTRGKALHVVALAMLAASASLAGCATPPTDPAARAEFERTNDPLEPWNRKVFAFNLYLDDHVGKPVALAYRDNVPKFARDRFRDFYDNFTSPVTFVNDVLQGESGRAAETATRFWVNSLFGMAGFFDVAGQYGLKKHKEDFGQTLAVWGVDPGPYLMVPVIGPSNPRDLSGKVVDSFLNPISYALSNAGVAWLETIAGIVDQVDERSRLIEPMDELRRTSLDFYASVRSLYRQNRASEISNGKPTKIPLPGEGDE